ncbi:F-box protein At2g26160-like [Phoenix dactylifera]|uniref:F-box protein At2g26160-like n=1 Tax=Phoenix dactylifera TaxID=42345 RepID=A0A8B7BDX2_PHODC|nr:F-box protein At2g26160-like [Phoenix dactylifera]
MIAPIHLGKHGAKANRFPNKIRFRANPDPLFFPISILSQPLTRCCYKFGEAKHKRKQLRRTLPNRTASIMKKPHLLHEEMKEPMVDWSMLCADLLREIAAFLLAGDVVDYIGLRSVCKAWRSATADPRGATFHAPPPRSWIMLCSDGDGGKFRHFFHLSTGKSLRLRLPELDHHKIIGCADGLLLLQDKATAAVRLLNPFTNSLTHLPPLEATEDELDPLRVTSAAVTFSFFSGLSTVLLSFYHSQRLAFANVGDGSWVMTDRLENFHFTSTLCYQGRFYATDYNGSIAVCSIGPPPTVTPVVVQSFDLHVMNSYLVESAGDLLLVRRYYSCAISGGFVDTSKFQVFKVDLSGRAPRLVLMKSLGDRALFLAQDRTLSVSAKDFPGIRANSIYFGVCSLQDSAGVFHLEDGSFESLSYHQGSMHGGKAGKELLCRPFSLFDHLLCYCEHEDWSKGVMYSGFC